MNNNTDRATDANMFKKNRGALHTPPAVNVTARHAAVVSATGRL